MLYEGGALGCTDAPPQTMRELGSKLRTSATRSGEEPSQLFGVQGIAPILNI